MLDKEGFHGEYNFIYVPSDLRGPTSFGFAFVNLVSNEAAMRMLEQLQGFEGYVADGKEALEVRWNEPHQGLEVQIGLYKTSPILSASVPDELKPMLFESGLRVPFPTKPVQVYDASPSCTRRVPS